MIGSVRRFRVLKDFSLLVRNGSSQIDREYHKAGEIITFDHRDPKTGNLWSDDLGIWSSDKSWIWEYLKEI